MRIRIEHDNEVHNYETRACLVLALQDNEDGEEKAVEGINIYDSISIEEAAFMIESVDIAVNEMREQNPLAALLADARKRLKAFVSDESTDNEEDICAE